MASSSTNSSLEATRDGCVLFPLFHWAAGKATDTRANIWRICMHIHVHPSMRPAPELLHEYTQFRNISSGRGGGEQGDITGTRPYAVANAIKPITEITTDHLSELSIASMWLRTCINPSKSWYCVHAENWGLSRKNLSDFGWVVWLSMPDRSPNCLKTIVL